MNLKSKLSDDIAKWKLDESKLSKEDKEVLSIINFPTELGYRDAAQMVIQRMAAIGGFIDKPSITINDVKFKVTSKINANWYLSRHTLPDNANEVAKQHLQGVMKSKAKQFIYVDGNYMDELLQTMLDLFSSPKPTPGMIAEKKKEDKPKKKRASRKRVLTEEEKAKIEDMAYNQSMDIKEINSELNIPQTTIKEYLKSLKNG